ncbi:uncharacterized protein LOC135365878 [Ornithodoros turicata]|uniref:uncharacterized protein LOC135365878 n=1 Tax=Ornithodoros turicata TaxID=34597 RepID=UPI0031397228
MASETQKLLLLSLLEESPELCSNRRFLECVTAAQRRAKWDRIAATLYAVGTYNKDGKGWQQFWKHWRHSVQSRARELSRRLQATRGGSGNVVANMGPAPVNTSLRLSGLDRRVMALVGWDTTVGVPGAVEMSIETGRMEVMLPVSVNETEPVPSTSAGLRGTEESGSRSCSLL